MSYNKKTFQHFRDEVRCLRETTIPDFKASAEWLESYAHALKNQSINVDLTEMLGFDPAERVSYLEMRVRNYENAIQAILRGERANPTLSINKCRDGIALLYREVARWNEEIYSVHVKVEDACGLPAIIVYSANRPSGD